MADKPILFSGPMVRALLAGTKTQTRRAVKDAGLMAPPYNLRPSGSGGVPISISEMGFIIYREPRYRVGDRLYVREHWRTYHRYDATPPRDLLPNVGLFFEANPPVEPGEPIRDLMRGKHRQAMHMPRWASRITLTVTEVRVERLQDISEEDAFAEGIPTDQPVAGLEIDIDGDWWAGAARARYRKVWEAINGPGAWEANPWVAAYSFRVQLSNIDQLEKEAA